MSRSNNHTKQETREKKERDRIRDGKYGEREIREGGVERIFLCFNITEEKFRFHSANCSGIID